MTGDAALLVLLAPLLLVTLVRLEKRGWAEVAVVILLALLIVEALIYPSQNEVPGGIFHPSIAGQAFRLPEYFIPIALLARVIARGFPRRAGATAVMWIAFITWYGLGTLVGMVFGHSFNEILFQSKAVLYVGGGALLAAGVPPQRLANRGALRRMLLVLGATVGLLAPMAMTKTLLVVHLPLVPRAVIGLLSPDAATILVTIAVVTLLFEATRRRRYLPIAIAAVPLLLSPFIATQRAAILGLAMMLGTVGLAMVGPTWRRRIRGTPTEGLLLIGILLIPILTTVIVRSIWPPTPEASILPFADVVTETFVAERKTQSADTRLNLWREGMSQTREYPAMGWGLGKTYDVERAGRPSESLVGGGFHNIAVDLLVRRGVVGLVLFVVAMAMTLSDAFLAWRRHADRYLAVLGFSCGAALVGLLAKGMVESLFEKFRLATLMGLLIGIIISCASALRSSGTRDINDYRTDEVDAGRLDVQAHATGIRT